MQPNGHNCQSIEPLLDAFHDGELSGSEKTEVEAHVGSCSQCLNKLRQINRLVHILRTVPPAKAPSGLSARLDSIAEGSGSNNNVVVLRAKASAWRMPLTVAAAAAAVVLVYKFTMPPVPSTTTASVDGSNQQAPVVSPPGQTAGQHSATQVASSAVHPPDVQSAPPIGTAERSAKTSSDERSAPPLVARGIDKSAVAEQAGKHGLAETSPVAVNRNSDGSSNFDRQPWQQVPLIANSSETAATEDELAELPNASTFNDALGIATDEDGLYDIKM
jgi:hypothetical protein